ncbi:efflux RND transporter periplasmic adaptor subunit [Corticibacterium sp. UT-5YL-CI-8]|nr:efflux RND transporter periplasmic adaptor subunit [Tianweitania sp. UT-5YL-CI-8]
MKRFIFCTIIMMAASSAFIAVASADATGSKDAPLVGVVSVQVRDVAPATEFVGRVEAIKSVDILSRVSGFLQSRLFNEGDTVRKGQDLFVIESDAYEIALTEAESTLASARAAETDAERQMQRNRTLIGRQAVAQTALEQSETALDSARATTISAEARVRQAQLNLSYTTIKSPFDGRIGRSGVSEGGLVNSSSGALARVVQTDPIRVVFSVSDRTILDLRQMAGGLGKEQLAKRFTTELRLSNGQPYDHPGAIDFFDNEIDLQTGTLAIRAQFVNPRSILVPGQFVTVVVREAEPKPRPIVPLGAVQQDREGKFVFIVDGSDHVAVRRISVSEQRDGNWIVEDGLQEGERVILEGLQNAAPGMVVNVTAIDPRTQSDDAAHPVLSGTAP